MRSFLVLCTSVGALNIQRRSDPEPWKCYHNTPTNYRGTQDSSNDGRKCMPWSAAAEDAQLQGVFSQSVGGASADVLKGNFCRAFSNADARPWCFVLGYTDAGSARQECDIVQCPSDGVWAKSYTAQGQGAIDSVRCTTKTGDELKNCDCTCDGAGGRSFVQYSKALQEDVQCHC